MADALIDIAPVLAARSHTFTIEGIGDFTLHRPTNGDKIKIGQRVNVRSGGVTLADNEAAYLVKIGAILDVLADEKPKGFDFDKADDDVPFYNFFAEYNEWLSSFRRSEATNPGA